MQPDRQHELEQNDLAGNTIDLLERIRPHLRSILTAVGILFVGLAAWTLVSSQQTAARAQSWEACMNALSSGKTEALADVARRHPGTPAAQWARLTLADTSLDQGCDLLFADRVQGTTRLEDAAARYAELLAERPAGMLAERAVFGLAKANEALGRLDEARKGYESVAADFPGGAWAGLASARVAALSRESTREWYDWFAGWTPAPPPANAVSTSTTEPVAEPAKQ